jgi:hypothetical protein
MQWCARVLGVAVACLRACARALVHMLPCARRPMLTHSFKKQTASDQARACVRRACFVCYRALHGAYLRGTCCMHVLFVCCCSCLLVRTQTSAPTVECCRTPRACARRTDDNDASAAIREHQTRHSTRRPPYGHFSSSPSPSAALRLRGFRSRWDGCSYERPRFPVKLGSRHVPQPFTR